VTPSFNSGLYIEQTIRSILLQDYPNLEYIVVDGCSSDESLMVLNKYLPWLDKLIVEPDRGQADAIAKGLSHCTGSIFNWINADDIMEEDSLLTIASNFTSCDLLAGCVLNFSTEAFNVIYNSHLDFNALLSRNTAVLHQPGIWFQRDKIQQIAPFHLDYRYTFDWVWILLYLQRWPQVKYTNTILVRFRLHSQSKSVAERANFFDERTISTASILLNRDLKPTETSTLLQFLLPRFSSYVQLGRKPELNTRQILSVFFSLFSLQGYLLKALLKRFTLICSFLSSIR
jgi:glycosyltransferase involved in cell wall biosynthesis